MILSVDSWSCAALPITATQNEELVVLSALPTSKRPMGLEWGMLRCLVRTDAYNMRGGCFGEYVCPAGPARPASKSMSLPSIPTLYPKHHPPSSPGYLTLAVLGAHVFAEWLHHHCLLGGPQQGGKKWGGKGDNRGENRGKLCSACPGPGACPACQRTLSTQF